ncbi:hypothetical protein TRFO_28041 [Tritrichomonas foetus]|uniref:Adenylate and Guanylate cyclase catalytic domain containing protein n=1 Tax=Tritrichomonas foetus TaxID=1144522 RepID=A0A1J4K458_9EUKA|nr:hypothetical protein TRFO_28041 [Tritrichomonas foetus]|eukprot:OHT04478.1 hypothetical protein TRFO_28041 [Tritrichomonas foetus]
MSYISSRSEASARTQIMTTSQNLAQNDFDDSFLYQLLEKFIFPLFSQLSFTINLPQIWHIIHFIITVIQILCTVNFFGSNLIFPEISNIFKIFNGFNDLGISNSNFRDCFPQFISLTLIFSIFMIWILYIYFSFGSTRTFTMLELYVTSIIQNVMCIVVPFYSAALASSIKAALLETSNDGIYWSIAITIELIVLASLSIISSFLLSESSVINNSFYFCWDSKLFNYILLWISFNTFMSSFTEILARYVLFISIVFSLIFCCLIIYRVYFFPFCNFYMNIFFGGLFLGGTLIHILVIILFFKQILSTGYICLIELLILVVSWILFSIFSIKNRNIIQTILNPIIEDSTNEIIKLNEIQKNEHFDTIIFSSTFDVFRYLNIGISYQCNYFIDFSFQKYLMNNYPNKSIVFKLCQMASFFPGQNQFLSFILNYITRYMNLTVGQRNLLFQIRNTNQFRQSSSPNEAKMELNRIKKRVDNSISIIRWFWHDIIDQKNERNSKCFREISKLTNTTITTFYDAIGRYPNSIEINNEFTRFLIEGAADFCLAIDVHKKSISHEIGRTKMENDKSYISMINYYPKYLTKNILDSHGLLIDKDVICSYPSDSSLQTSSSSTSDNDYDAKREEIMKSLFSDARQRVTIQKALNNTNIHGLAAMVVMIISQVFITLFFYLLIILILPRISKNISPYIKNLNNMMTASATTQYLAILSGIHILEIFDEFQIRDNFTHDLKNPKDSYIFMHQQVKKNRIITQDFYQTVLSDAKSRSNEINTIFNATINFAIPTKLFLSDNQVKLTLKQSLTMYHNTVDEAASLGNASFSKEEKLDLANYYLLNILMNCEHISHKLSELTNFTVDNGIQRTKSYLKFLVILAYIVSGIFFFVLGILLSLVSIKLTKTIQKTLHLLQNTKLEAVKESFKPISLKSRKNDVRGNSTLALYHSDSFEYYFPFYIFLFNICATIFFIITGRIIDRNLSKYNELFDWNIYGGNRYIKLLESIMYNLRITIQNTSDSEVNSQMKQSLENASFSHSTFVKTIIGEDKSLNSEYLHDKCQINRSTNFHSFIECISLHLTYDIAELYVSSLISSELNSYSSTFINAIYIVEYDLFLSLYEFQNVILEYSNSLIKSQEKYIQKIICLAIILQLLFFTLVIFSTTKFSKMFCGVKQMIRLLPPSYVFQNSPLIDFILNNTENHSSEIAMTPSDAIVSASSNAILVISYNEIIQSVNDSLKKMTGFTPDQVLGQQLTWIFPIGDDKGVEDEQMKNFYEALDNTKKDENTTKSVVTKIITESGEFVPVKATFISTKDDSSEQTNSNDSILIMLRDLTKIQEQKKLLKNIMKKTEFLLSKLIPNEVLPTILSKSEPFTFISNQATVIYVELFGMLDYVHSLTPKQLIAVLNAIYDKFEETSKRYPAVHFIKTHDDLFVACAGLFDYQNDIKIQINQVLSFCCSINDEIDEVNDRLSVNIQLRFGINYGGPLIGQLINSSTPTFDLMGRVIQDAIKLQTKGELGEVQITNNVLEFVDMNKFNISDGIVLKDKEKISKNKEKEKYDIQIYIVHKKNHSASYAELPKFTPMNTSFFGLLDIPDDEV